MRSQDKWGVFFILFGVILFLTLIWIPIMGIIYGTLSILMGIALFIFRNEESKIEKIRREK